MRDGLLHVYVKMECVFFFFREEEGRTGYGALVAFEEGLASDEFVEDGCCERASAAHGGDGDLLFESKRNRHMRSEIRVGLEINDKMSISHMASLL